MPHTDKMMDVGKARTSGDGMETSETTKTEDKPTFSKTQLRRKDSTIQESIHQKKPPPPPPSTIPIPGLHTLYRPTETSRSLPACKPRGELRLLTPRLIDVREVPEHKKTKPPRFVPFEPYAGAVNPIFPNKDKSKKILKRDRNNLDIGVLVSHMSTMRTQELHEGKEGDVENETPVEKHSEDPQVAELKAELAKIKEERDYLNSQLKFQSQVNSELKGLLVASVGEDLQTRVNVLTEDKLQLARALLDTANNLTTHSEQIEFLASQCEVWRSKFLASSVMVEELARWKADLTQKNELLTESTKRLLRLSSETRKTQIDILKNLKFMGNIKYLNLPSTDVRNLGAECLNILQQMALHSGVGIPENLYLSNDTQQLTQDEQFAIQALEFISQPLIATDDAIKALFGQTRRSYVTANSEVPIEEPSV
ncbi:golgin-45 [Episyrphus balteatus]|uniref:golgin-45 n=1 Tax=Episyrphus balteatus TaxID=286459 RepID=UPI0024855475|nr:golgin-45 [Episyrphus balteatus]